MSLNFKMIAGLLGLLMLLAFLIPPAIKLKKIALAIVIIVGVAMAAYEFYEQLRNKDNQDTQ